MSTTVQDIYDRAITRSSLNNQDLYPLSTAIPAVSFYESQMIALANIANPDFFGTEGLTNVRTDYTAPWSLSSAPGNVGLITRVEVATIAGTVTDVAVNDKVDIINVEGAIHGLVPRCYIRNQKLYGYSTDLGTSDTNMVTQLKVWYTATPTMHSSGSSVLIVPDMWANLVVAPIAAEMAMADLRPDDYDRLHQEFDKYVQVFVKFVESTNYTAVQGFGYRNVGGP